MKQLQPDLTMKKGNVVRQLINGRPAGQTYIVTKGGKDRSFCHAIEDGVENVDTTYQFGERKLTKIEKVSAEIDRATFEQMSALVNPTQLRFKISVMWVEVYFKLAGYDPGEFVIRLYNKALKKSMYIYLDRIDIVHPGDKKNGFIRLDNIRKA